MKREGTWIQFWDENVDGRGDSAVVLIRTERLLAEDSVPRLQRRLTELKGSDECLNTDDMVQIACDEILGRGAWRQVLTTDIAF